MLLQQVRSRTVRVEPPPADPFLLEVLLDALRDPRIRTAYRLHRHLVRQFAAVGLVYQVQIEAWVEQILHIRVPHLCHFNHLDRVAVVPNLAVLLLDPRLALRGDVHHDRQVHVVVSQQGQIRREIVRAPDWNRHPSWIERLTAARNHRLAQHLQVDLVRRRAHQQTMGRQEQRLRNAVAHSHLQWEHRLRVVNHDVCGYDRPSIVHVLHRPDAAQPIQVDHERRVRGVDYLMLGREALVDEAQEVALSQRMEVQARLIEEQHHAAVLIFQLQSREVRQEREEPHEPLRALVEGHRDAVTVVPNANVQDRPLVEWRRVVRIRVGKIEIHPQLPILMPVLEHVVRDAD